MLSCGGTKSPSFGHGFTTYIVGGAGTDETFNGVINNYLYGNSADGDGTTTIVKEGEGLWRLNGNNTYIGTTTVTRGKLIINGNNAGAGKVTVDEDATLAGKGSITGEVDVTGMLEPGDGSIGTLTLKDKLTLQATSTTSIDIDKTGNAWDKISVTSNITYGGTLKINFTGTPASGDVFKIFSTPAAISGTITQFEPATPGPGLLWVFKQATGELAIQTPNFVEAPSNLNLNAPVAKAGSPSTVNFSWTDNSDNEDYFILERSTDNVNFVDVGHSAANTTTYTDGGLQSGVKYYYRIKAHSPLNESIYSPVASVTTPAEGTLPTVTANLSPSNNASNLFLDNNTISLSWSGNYADVYEVYLGTSSNSLTKVADVPAGTSTYAPPSLDPNTKYYWRIDGKNDNGTTTGTIWNFQTANIPVTVAGDYRSAESGNWGTSSVATDIWEVYDGTNWNATTTLPSSSTPTVSIRTGHTVRLNATTTANNLVIESGATLISGASDGASGTVTQRNIRVISSINNFGTVGSSSTATNRLNFEGYRKSGTVYITGTSTYYLNTFTVNSIAQNTEVEIDANLNLASYMRANYSTATTLPWTSDPQNDDNISITLNEGKTVTMSSSGYLQAGSSPTTNTIAEFGNYTFNINGTLDMRSTGTSCIVGHATRASVTTINVNGTWLMGNAIRFIPSGSAAPVGSVALNIGANGVVDAGARTINSSNTATNIVVTNTSFNQTVFFNISGGGLLKSRVSTSEVLFPVGSGNTYSPVKLTNTGTANIIGVGVKTGLDYPIGDPSKVINKQYSVIPSTAAGVNLAISLGWLTANQGANFNPSGASVQGRYNSNSWSESAATITGAGTITSPYYAKVSGYTDFGTFAVGQAGSVNDVEAPTAQCKPVEVTLGLDGTVAITAEQVNNGSSDKSGVVNLSVSPSNFTAAQVGANTVTLTVTDASGNKAECSSIVTVKKRPVTLVYTGAGSAQYSDQQSLTATLTDQATGTVLSGKTIRFDIGAQTKSGTTDATGVASVDLVINQDPAAAYSVKSEFAGDELFLPASEEDPFDILQEDARAYYTGTLFASTGAGSTTTVTLSATIRDITAETGDASTDAFEGNIQNATVTFIDRTTNTVIATVPVGLVNLGDKKVGTATYNWSVDIGNNNAKDYTIGIQVSNYYQRNVSEENTIITVSKSLDDFITGGGYLKLVRPSGQKAGDVDSRNNFGFSVKFNKSKTNLQGNINTIVRRTESDGVHVYQVKGNVLTSLSTTSATGTTQGKATFNGKASIQDITNPMSPVSVDGNATIQVEMTDRGELGTGDAIGITIWNKAGGVWFASNWDGIRTQEQVLAGGNIKINNGIVQTVALSSISATTANMQAMAVAEDNNQGDLLEVSVSPNPTTSFTKLTIQGRPAEGNVRLSVMDLSGRLIELKEIVPSRATIQLGEAYRPGIYLIEVRQGRERKVVKLIKLAE
ncbi:T9SS type A sorting domain-containing protein [Chitinophagaceae bacterium LB-8]|uniref:T9SS type A sorting domain-containing protein n=2 Tax=Paraflavisolibacter caeni TaxID=2982496 RepID=A0A9X2XZT2_9BACT|nr:T9SS type A sorting domain-containing protein [Paraflavisolibacter caeni]